MIATKAASITAKAKVFLIDLFTLQVLLGRAKIVVRNALYNCYAYRFRARRAEWYPPAQLPSTQLQRLP